VRQLARLLETSRNPAKAATHGEANIRGYELDDFAERLFPLSSCLVSIRIHNPLLM